MLRWSGNLLASAVIVILGLVAGRQITSWWREPPAAATLIDPAASPQFDQLADPLSPLTLTFGDAPYAFERRIVLGDEATALHALRAMCRPATQPSAADHAPPLTVSDQTLDRLSSSPTAEQGDGWRLVQHGGPVITVVALGTAGSRSLPVSTEAQARELVVSWGLGLRAVAATSNSSPRDQWTLYACSGQRRTSGPDPCAGLRLPPGAQRSFAVRVWGGGALVGFRGGGSLDSARRFLDSVFAERGWNRATAWTPLGNTWHVRFEDPESTACDIQLFVAHQETTGGLLTLSPAAPTTPSKTEN